MEKIKLNHSAQHTAAPNGFLPTQASPFQFLPKLKAKNMEYSKWAKAKKWTSKNFIDLKGKIHWQYIKIIFHTIESLLWRHTSCSIYYQDDSGSWSRSKSARPTGHEKLSSFAGLQSFAYWQILPPKSWIFLNQNWQRKDSFNGRFATRKLDLS